VYNRIQKQEKTFFLISCNDLNANEAIHVYLSYSF